MVKGFGVLPRRELLQPGIDGRQDRIGLGFVEGQGRGEDQHVTESGYRVAVAAGNHARFSDHSEQRYDPVLGKRGSRIPICDQLQPDEQAAPADLADQR